MTINNYAPFTTAQIPDSGVGPMSGLRRSRADFMLRQAQMQGLEGMMLGNQMSQMQNQRYGASTPHELDKLSWDAAQARGKQNMPGYLEAMLGGDVAKNESEGYKRDITRNTMQSGMDQTNATNQLGALTNQLMRVHSIGSANPMLGQAEYQRVLGTIRDPQLRRLLPAMYDRTTFDQTLDVLSRTPTQRGEERVKKFEAESREKVGRGNNAATRYTADKNYERAIEVAELRRQMQQTRDTFQNYLIQAVKERVAKGEMTKAQGDAAIERIAYQFKQSGAGTIDPGAGIREVFPGIAPRPLPTPVLGDEKPKPGTAENPIILD